MKAIRSFVPPRPNLDPEPWPGSTPSIILTATYLIGALVLLCAAIRFLRRRTRPVSRSVTAIVDTWTSAAIEIRRLLAAQLGADYLARTTEEIGVSLRGSLFLSDEHANQVLMVLVQSDLIKFAAVDSCPLTPGEQAGLLPLWQALAGPSTRKPR